MTPEQIINGHVYLLEYPTVRVLAVYSDRVLKITEPTRENGRPCRVFDGIAATDGTLGLGILVLYDDEIRDGIFAGAQMLGISDVPIEDLPQYIHWNHTIAFDRLLKGDSP